MLARAILLFLTISVSIGTLVCAALGSSDNLPADADYELDGQDSQVILQPPTDLWERAAQLGGHTQKYTQSVMNSVLAAHGEYTDKLVHIKDSVSQMLSAAGQLRAEMLSVAENKDTTFPAGTIEGTTQENTIAGISNSINTAISGLLENLSADSPVPDHALSHKEREDNARRVFMMAEDAIVRVFVKNGSSEDRVRTLFERLREHVIFIVVTIGDFAERHPKLVHTLLSLITAWLFPESWLLRPLLCLFGFGSLGPTRGGIAAWAQGFFFGGVVQKGSWFALLQNAGMTPIGAPIKNGIIGAVTGAVGFIAGFL